METLYGTLGLGQSTQGKTDWEGDPVPKVMVQTLLEKVQFSPLNSREVCLLVQIRTGLQSLVKYQATFWLAIRVQSLSSQWCEYAEGGSPGRVQVSHTWTCRGGEGSYKIGDLPGCRKAEYGPTERIGLCESRKPGAHGVPVTRAADRLLSGQWGLQCGQGTRCPEHVAGSELHWKSSHLQCQSPMQTAKRARDPPPSGPSRRKLSITFSVKKRCLQKSSHY